MLRSHLLIIFCLATGANAFSQDQPFDPSQDIKIRRLTFEAETISLEDPFEATIKAERIRLANIVPADTANLLINQVLRQIAEANIDITKARGYRIQVYTGKDRDRAIEIADSLQKETIEKVIYKFEVPYHIVKVGNYLSKIEAYQLYTDLSEGLEDALLVSDIIDIEKAPLDHMTDENEGHQKNNHNHAGDRPSTSKITDQD